MRFLNYADKHIIKHERCFLKRGAFNFAWPCPNDLPPLTTNSKTKLKCVRYQTKNVTDDGMWHLYIRPSTLPSCLHPEFLAWSIT